jgi:hypothetical protein
VVALTPRRFPVPGVGAALFVTYLIVGTFLVIPRITADGVAYYAETRSLILDGDLDLANEYAIPVESYSPLGDAGPRAVVPRAPDGSFEHDVNLGMVVLLGPFLLAAQLVATAANALAAAVGAAAPFALNGYDRINVLAVAFGVNAMVAAGLAFLGRYLEPLVGRFAAIGAAIATWLGTGLFFWSTQRPAHAHAVLIVVECAFVVLFLARGRDVRDRWAWLVLGALWGLMLTVRPIAGLYAAVPAGFLVLVEGGRAFRVWAAEREEWRGRATRSLRVLGPAAVAGLLFLAGSLLGRVPQLIFGGDASLLGSGYYADTAYVRGAINGDLLSGGRSLLLDVDQGLVWWLPLVPLSLLGLLAIWRRDRGAAVAAITWVALIWGFAAALDAPERFGGLGIPSRHLVEATPAYVIGVAGLLAGSRDLAAWLAGRSSARVSRAVGIGGAALVSILAAWGAIAQVAGSVVSVEGLPPAARVAAVLGRPLTLGRLWYAPAEQAPAAGKVDLGGHLAAAAATGNGPELWQFITGFVWLALIGALVVGAAMVLCPLLLRRAVAAAAAPPAPAARSAGATGSTRRRLATAAISWIPLALAAALVVGLAAPAFAAAGAERDGAWTTLRSWDGRRQPPTGVVTSVTYGRSPSGNAAILPPVAAAPTETDELDLMTRGTFGELGAGREALISPPFGWDVVTDVVLWFGPTFDPDAAVEVSIGPDDGSPPSSIVLSAADIALGVVPVPLPILARGTTEPVRLRVSEVPGRPSPLVSIRGDGSVAHELRGLPSRFLPPVRLAGVDVVPFDPLFSLPENGSVTVDEDGASMRIGPWGPEQILRWSSAHAGWTVDQGDPRRASWNDALIRTADAEPLIVAMPAPLPIESMTVHVVASADSDLAATSATDGPVVTLEASTDGAAWTSIAEEMLADPNRPVDVTGMFEPPDGARQVLFRISDNGAPGEVRLNTMWLDAALVAPPNELGQAGSKDLDLPVEAISSLFAPVSVEIATGPGRVNAGLRAAASVAQTVVFAPGAWLGLLLAAALVIAAFIARRRDAPVPLVAGILSLALLFGLSSALAFVGPWT